MRWWALGVDYEMSGKDLIDSVKLSGKLCKVLGALPPIGYTYELFLDERGQKISKSRGNGLSVEGVAAVRAAGKPEPVHVQPAAPCEKTVFRCDTARHRTSTLRMWNGRASRRKARRVGGPDGQPGVACASGPHPGQRGLAHPFRHAAQPGQRHHAESADMLWGFVGRYLPRATPETEPFLARLVDHAVLYFQDFVRPRKKFRAPDATDVGHWPILRRRCAPSTRRRRPRRFRRGLCGRQAPSVSELKELVRLLYQVLLGQDEGPRFGGFVALYGVAETVALIERQLAPAEAPA